MSLVRRSSVFCSFKEGTNVNMRRHVFCGEKHTSFEMHHFGLVLPFWAMHFRCVLLLL